jgi:Domain of unknown function (DUF4411)
MPARYSIDTSSLVAAWAERYPIDVFPSFWDRLAALIATGDLVACREVLRELERRDKDLYDWCKAHDGFAIEIDELMQEHVINIMGKYPKFVDERTKKSAGDPFVIALAMQHNPGLTVVTEENGGTAQRPMIPFVCQEEGVACFNLLQLIREQGWKI